MGIVFLLSCSFEIYVIKMGFFAQLLNYSFDMKPSEIYFSKGSVSPYFDHGTKFWTKSLEESLNDLVHGR